MEHLEQFIAETGKQPTDWTSDDIETYIDSLKSFLVERNTKQNSTPEIPQMTLG
jgi:hypothetical protein